MYRIFIAFTIAIIHCVFAASYQPSEKFSYLQETSNAFANIAKKNIPAVVLIQAKVSQGPTADIFAPLDPSFEDFLRRFFGGHMLNNSSPLQGVGSGFFVTDNGYILTNYHVIKNAQEIAVITHSGTELQAELVGSDPSTDLAVLKVDLENVDYIEFADSDQLVTGEWVVAIGHPYKLNHTVTAGIVSATAKTRDHLNKITQIGGVIQTDAAINPGNSGGPLVNLDGKLVGVNVAIATNNGSFAGISFAIPSTVAKHVLEKIIDKGVVDRAYLGIILQNIDKELAEATNLKPNTGILITEVVDNSPAKKAGLKNGDIILSMNGKPVHSMNAFRNQIALMAPETKVSLKVRRQAETLEIDVYLGLLSELEAQATPIIEKMGLELEDFANIPAEVLAKYGFSPNSHGVLITNVKKGSPAKYAGINTQQVITGIVFDWNHQVKINNKEELHKALQEIGDRKHIVLIVQQRNLRCYRTVKLH